MSELLNEMYTILGWPKADNPTPDPYTPRDVIGTFQGDVPTALDEVILESIAELGWDDVFDIALLGALGPEDLSRMTTAYHEGTSEFRDFWNTLVEDGMLERDMKRGVFVLLAKACPQTESMSRYVQWCMRVIRESTKDIQEDAVKRSSKLEALIPAGSQDKHQSNIKASEKYLTPHTMATDRPKDGNEVMKNGVFKADVGKSGDGMAKVVKAEKAMKKVADTKGLEVDQAFPNLFIDLARERARNS